MREFDDIIRGKLEQLPSEGTPDWTAFESRLEGDAFDSLLRDQLSSKTSLSGADKVAPAIVGWQALSGKLDIASELEGDVFDRILSQKLNNTETVLEPNASWKVLSHRMDTLWPLRKVLVRYRVIEMAAAIALLLTFAPLLQDNPVSVARVSPTSTQESLPQESVEQSATSTGEFLQPEEIAALVYTSNSAAAENLPFNSAGSTSKATQAVTDGSSIYSPFALLKGAFNWFATPNISSTSVLAAQQDAQQQQSLLNANLNSSKASTPLVFSSDNSASLDLQALDNLLLSPLATVGSKPLQLVSLAKTKKSKWEVGAQTGIQAWNVRTPADLEFEQGSSSRWIGGFSLGVAANRMLGERTALGFGISLTPLHYDPNLPIVLDAADVNSTFSFNRSESFEGISVNITQVPVDFRVRLTPKNNSTSIWAFGGLAANLTLSSRFDLQQEYGFATGPNSGPPGSELERVIETERTFSDVKTFSPGILEDGGLVENTFFAARAGLEVSHQFNDRLSAFSSLNYNHHLSFSSGFGPNNDKLNSIGLRLGGRIRL